MLASSGESRPHHEAETIMLRELVVSIVSGIVVAMVLGMFRSGGGRSAPQPRSTARYYEDPPRRNGGFFGGLMRFILSVGGGLALAYAAMPFIFGRRFGRYDGYDRFGDFDGIRGLTNHAPILILTVVGTIIVWSILSALTRR
jgi:hypothetical protein